MHPVVMAPLAWEPDPTEPLLHGGVLVNLLYGLVHRCAVWSAGYDHDYHVPTAIVATMAGTDRWRHLADLAARAGYWSPVEGGWQLVADSEHLFHIRLKAEKDWEAQRKKDNGNPALIVPVRLRDGDGCRYCGKIVSWTARRGNRAGTYDHVHSGQPATGPDDLVVCCGWCNSTRGKDATFDEDHPRRPAPVTPFYGKETVELLALHGIDVPCSTPARPGHQPGHADRTATPQPAGPRAPRDPAASATPRTASPGGSVTTPDPHQHGATPQPAGPRDAIGDPAPGRTPHPARPRTRRAPAETPQNTRPTRRTYRSRQVPAETARSQVCRT